MNKQELLQKIQDEVFRRMKERDLVYSCHIFEDSLSSLSNKQYEELVNGYGQFLRTKVDPNFDYTFSRRVRTKSLNYFDYLPKYMLLEEFIKTELTDDLRIKRRRYAK